VCVVFLAVRRSPVPFGSNTHSLQMGSEPPSLLATEVGASSLSRRGPSGWAPLLELFPVVSLVANFTLVVAMLSYAGQLNITPVADRDGCPDVEVFAQGVRGTLDHLARSVLVPSS
jgi:hypothetical protein